MTITYRIIYALVRLMSVIPLHVAQFIGRMLGRAFARVPLSRTKISLDNLRHAFGNCMTDDEIKTINKQVIMHFGEMLFEVPHILRLKPTNLDKYVVFQGEKNFLEAIGKGKGTFILTGHFGNWELMSAAITLGFDFSSAVVVRPIDFSPADRMISQIRSRFGTKIIDKQHAMRSIIRALKKNSVIGILLDQNVDWYEGAFVPFFGSRACTNKGLALIALRTGAPVIPVFSVKQPDGRYRIIFEKEVKLLITGDNIRDLEENTALFSRILEGYIRRYPDHWFWFHRRWKTRPFCPIPKTDNMRYAEGSRK